jgi:hypothetical protein
MHSVISSINSLVVNLEYSLNALQLSPSTILLSVAAPIPTIVQKNMNSLSIRVVSCITPTLRIKICLCVGNAGNLRLEKISNYFHRAKMHAINVLLKASNQSNKLQIKAY